MVCRSAGWYPQPEVLWKDPSGQRLPSVSQRHFSDERGLFDVAGIIIMTGKGNEKWSCVVRNSRLNQQQETSLHISGALSSFDLGFPVQGVGCGGTGGVCTFTAVLVHERTGASGTSGEQWYLEGRERTMSP